MVFVLFVFVFYGLLVSPVLSKANQRQNHIRSMETQIPRLVKKRKRFSSIKEQVKTLEQYNTEEKFSIPERHSVPIFLSALNEAISSSGITIIVIASWS